MQAHGPLVSPLSLAAMQLSAEPLEMDERDNKFDDNDSLTGDPEQDQLLLGLVLSLVQLLMQQFHDQQQGNGSQGEGSGQQETLGRSNSNNDLSSQFSTNDKNLLLNAVGTNPASGITINAINDNNSSGNLNGGDNLQLQTNNSLQNRTITDPEVRSFIDQRNPPGTTKLPLTSDQTSLLQQQHGFSEVAIADINGDNRISVGDVITGTKPEGPANLQLDIPVDSTTLTQLSQNAGTNVAKNQGSNNTNLATSNTASNTQNTRSDTVDPFGGSPANSQTTSRGGIGAGNFFNAANTFSGVSDPFGGSSVNTQNTGGDNGIRTGNIINTLNTGPSVANNTINTLNTGTSSIETAANNVINTANNNGSGIGANNVINTINTGASNPANTINTIKT